MLSFEDLKNRITECNRCGKNDFCPFPIYKGVKGFLGDKDYIFVAVQPSMTIFPSNWDERLYACMAKYGFQDAHLTDLVKCRREADKELSQTEIQKCIGWLDEEIKIVKPKVIIALGIKKNSTFDVLQNHLKNKDTPVLGVTHYSNRFISDTKFEKEFQTLRYYLDLGNYRHGMKIKEWITPEQRKIQEEKQLFGSFIVLLNKLKARGKISAAQWRTYGEQWQKSPLRRDALVQRLTFMLEQID